MTSPESRGLLRKERRAKPPAHVSLNKSVKMDMKACTLSPGCFFKPG